jgi:hypothetical protein
MTRGSPALLCLGAAVVLGALGSTAAEAGLALRFHGNGVAAPDLDRVKIALDAPARPADVGGDFTLEFWLKALLAENPAGPCFEGSDNWIHGNIVFDRDVYGDGDRGDYGLSLLGGRVAFGLYTASGGGAGLCGATVVADGAWHHVAVTRSAATGLVRLFVDGRLDAEASGPGGDVSYRDGRATPYPNDPFLVIGAEKHDAGAAYASYSGWIDEVRISRVVRYGGDFARPAGPFAPDADTVALYHFDEGGGDAVLDSSGAPGGPSHGVRRFGGTPAGPEWTADTPFAPGGGTGPFDGDRRADPAVYRGSTGQWLIQRSAGGSATVTWGDPAQQDRPVSADFDGDGQGDLAVYRGATGQWFVLRSGGGVTVLTWGDPAQLDTPVPADFDGDGRADVAVYRKATGQWFVLRSGGGVTILTWGDPAQQDVPVPGRYDGDGRADVAVYRGSTGQWFVLGSGGGVTILTWGDPGAGDLAAPADYDGDGRDDYAVYRGTSGQWFVLGSSGAFLAPASGAPGAGDQPVPLRGP